MDFKTSLKIKKSKRQASFKLDFETSLKIEKRDKGDLKVGWEISPQIQKSKDKTVSSSMLRLPGQVIKSQQQATSFEIAV